MAPGNRDVNAVLALTEVMRPANAVVVPALVSALRVLGTRTHVQQIVLNLVIAAFRALEDQDPREESVVRVTTSASGLGGRLVVEDNGPGVPSRLRSRCFDPFAMPRGPGQWNGLGLWAVKRIALMLGGTVEFRSDQARGTVVVVELPASA